MPYKDPVIAAEKAKERKKRYRERQHQKRYGPNAGDQRGKHGNTPKAESHYKWKAGQLISSEGYVLVRVGVTHPLANSIGYAYEHWVVWVSAGRTAPGCGELIHHINGCKTDNRIENLEMMTASDHNRLHNKEKGRDKQGRFVGKKAAGRLLNGRTWEEVPG